MSTGNFISEFKLRTTGHAKHVFSRLVVYARGIVYFISSVFFSGATNYQLQFLMTNTRNQWRMIWINLTNFFNQQKEEMENSH